MTPEQHDRDQEEKADDVLGRLLERRQPAARQQRRREDVPPVDAREKQRRVPGETRQGHAHARAPADEERRHDEGSGEEQARSQPHLRRRVGRVADQTEAGIVDDMHDVKGGDRPQRDAQEDGEIVVQELAQRPGHDQHAEADDDEDDLGQGVKEEVGVQSREVQQGEQHDADDRGQAIVARPYERRLVHILHSATVANPPADCRRTGRKGGGGRLFRPPAPLVSRASGPTRRPGGRS